MTLTTVVSDLDIAGLPDTLKLWSCVGCGAMGNLSACTGACKFTRTEIVTAESYGDLLEQSHVIREQAQKLDVAIRRLAVLSEGQSDFEILHRQIQIEARDALPAFPAPASAIQATAEAEVASAEVWLCKTCGQVDAPQPCLGICVRRNGDHVRMEAFQALAKQVASRRRALEERAALLRRVRAVTPKAGQWEGAVLAYRIEATRLLQCAQSSDEKVPENLSPDSVLS